MIGANTRGDWKPLSRSRVSPCLDTMRLLLTAVPPRRSHSVLRHALQQKQCRRMACSTNAVVTLPEAMSVPSPGPLHRRSIGEATAVAVQKRLPIRSPCNVTDGPKSQRCHSSRDRRNQNRYGPCCNGGGARSATQMSVQQRYLGN
jgi:hypothetical protein